MPRLGKAGSPASRRAIVHSLVHTESWAVDLAWDAIARFGTNPCYQLPWAFFNDFVKVLACIYKILHCRASWHVTRAHTDSCIPQQVAEDEARHFELLHARLQELGCMYGDLPAHDGLWESAARTAHSLPARLAVEHCVHEGRGKEHKTFTLHLLSAHRHYARCREK